MYDRYKKDLRKVVDGKNVKVMDIEAFSRREKMLKLREELLAVEEERLAGRTGVTPDELDCYLGSIIDGMGPNGLC